MWIPVITILWALGNNATWVNFPMVNFPFSSSDKCYEYVAQIRSSIQDALDEVENFGRDARSIKNTLQNIKDPDNLKDSISNDSEKVKAIK